MLDNLRDEFFIFLLRVLLIEDAIVGMMEADTAEEMRRTMAVDAIGRVLEILALNCRNIPLQIFSVHYLQTKFRTSISPIGIPRVSKSRRTTIATSAVLAAKTIETFPAVLAIFQKVPGAAFAMRDDIVMERAMKKNWVF